MEPVTTVLSGIVVALSAGLAGKYIGNNGKITDDHCKERQKSCQELIITKIDNVEKKVDRLLNTVNHIHERD